MTTGGGATRRLARPPLAVVVALGVVLTGVAGWLAYDRWLNPDNEDHGWRDCTAPSIAAVPDLGRLGVDQPPDGALDVEAVVDVPSPTDLEATLDGSLLVTLKDGYLVRVVDDDVVVLLDLSDQVSGGSEQGLLGLALDPDRSRLYLTLTALDDDLELWAYDLDAAGFPIRDTDRVLMVVEQPHEWHNGGSLVLDADGHLWIGVGDGGSIADRYGHAQDPDTPLAAVLRIRPTDDAWEVPADNPWVGVPDRDERVVAYGLRNPWSLHVDEPTDRMWLTDVGQNCVEEVNVFARDELGVNFGWSRLEGTYRFVGQLPTSHRLPAFEYRHDDGGCAITGGGVYRGTAIPWLDGRYVFADYCRGALMALTLEGKNVTAVTLLGPRLSQLGGIEAGADGELYLLTMEDGIWRLVP